MGAQSPEPFEKNRITLRQFLVAHQADGLYDSRKVSKRVPKQDLVAIARAIILVAITGGAIWFVLWKLVTTLLGHR